MQSMEEIYQNYAKRVYRYLFSLTQNGDLAEELTQETFYQAICSIHQFDNSCQVSTWLCAIAKKQLMTYRRKHLSMETWEENNLTVRSAEAEVVDRVSNVELLKRLHELSEPFREIFYLRLFGELSFREIGTIFGKSENWARVTYYRGKEKLRKELEDDGK